MASEGQENEMTEQENRHGWAQILKKMSAEKRTTVVLREMAKPEREGEKGGAKRK